MGKNQSKEEIIIAQAGNSGGQTTTTSMGEWTFKEILCIGVLILAVLAIMAYMMARCKKQLQQTIRREIALSRETV